VEETSPELPVTLRGIDYTRFFIWEVSWEPELRKQVHLRQH